MDDKLQKSEKHELEEYELLSVESKEKRRQQALMFLGGIHTVGRISKALGSQEMRALETFQIQELYLDLGFENFVDFLNDDLSPITKNQYYDRIKILKSEGDQVFDLLNNAGISVSKRKLLGRGHIQVEGEKLIILGDNGDETEIEFKDRSRILETLSALADANAHKSIKIEREKKEAQRLRGVVGDLQKQVETERAALQADSLDPHSVALLNLISAFQLLKTEAENLTLVEKEQFAPRTFETIARQLDALSVAYNRISTMIGRADHLAHDTETPTDRQIRLHKEAVKEANVRENKKTLRVAASDIAQANDDELADLMD